MFSLSFQIDIWHSRSISTSSFRSFNLIGVCRGKHYNTSFLQFVCLFSVCRRTYIIHYKEEATLRRRILSRFHGSYRHRHNLWLRNFLGVQRNNEMFLWDEIPSNMVNTISNSTCNVSSDVFVYGGSVRHSDPYFIIKHRDRAIVVKNHDRTLISKHHNRATEVA